MFEYHLFVHVFDACNHNDAQPTTCYPPPGCFYDIGCLWPSPVPRETVRASKFTPLIKLTYSPNLHVRVQTFYDGYSLLKHNGGNGPYSTRESYGIDREPPAGCAVDQVIMLKRHGERYPDPTTGADFQASLAKVYASNTTFTGDLAFLNDWTYYVPSANNYSMYAQETYSGPYAGLLSNYILGTEYRARYGHLWDQESVIPFWSSGYERVIESARKFGEGFFGYNYSTNAALNIISESETQGADSLTPTCVNDNDTAICDSLTGLMPQFYVAAERFQKQGVNINASDVYYLMRKSFDLGSCIASCADLLQRNGCFRTECPSFLSMD